MSIVWTTVTNKELVGKLNFMQPLLSNTVKKLKDHYAVVAVYGSQSDTPIYSISSVRAVKRTKYVVIAKRQKAAIILMVGA